MWKAIAIGFLALLASLKKFIKGLFGFGNKEKRDLPEQVKSDE